MALKIKRNLVPTLILVGIVGPPTHLAAADGLLVPEVQVIGRRISSAPNEALFATTVISASVLQRSPGLRLDDVLSAVPGFGLFRRQPSRAAHPTTQGVTLRGLGASGAGRTLVMLDGIPQNDPFGGWIDWSRLPTATIGQAAITKGGGAGPWGNSALAGVVRLQSRDFVPGEAWFDGRAGTDTTLQVDGGASAEIGPAHVSISAHGQSTDGDFLISPVQRGPVDRRAGNKGFGGAAAVSFSIDDATHVFARTSYSEDRLINGSDPARSRSRIGDVSVSVVHERGGDQPAFQVNAYARDQSFAAVFASVDDLRTTAAPVLDQYAVPATAFGANIIARFPVGDGWSLETGGDLRIVSGTANEYFQNFGQGFLRERNAGGDQWVAGAFVEGTYAPNSRTTVTASARVDVWRQYNGKRRESLIVGGSIVRDDRFPASNGIVTNGRVGVRHQLTDTLAGRAVVYSGFRVPTLNELYRPFRVGNDITEANAGLKPERLYGGDLGVEWAPNSAVTTSLTYFHARLTDSVVNITVRTAPGLDLNLGVFVPPGGVLRQRRNLDRVRADGFEADFSVDLSANATLTARYLWSRPRVTRSLDQPDLVGNRLAQIPKHQGALALSIDAIDRWTMDIQARAASRQFEDDLNERSLDAYIVADFSTGYAINETATAYVAVENIFNRRIETGISATGLLSVGPSRQVTAGLRMGF